MDGKPRAVLLKNIFHKNAGGVYSYVDVKG